MKMLNLKAVLALSLLIPGVVKADMVDPATAQMALTMVAAVNSGNGRYQIITTNTNTKPVFYRFATRTAQLLKLSYKTDGSSFWEIILTGEGQ